MGSKGKEQLPWIRQMGQECPTTSISRTADSRPSCGVVWIPVLRQEHFIWAVSNKRIGVAKLADLSAARNATISADEQIIS
jgi:hypothetical protein